MTVVAVDQPMLAMKNLHVNLSLSRELKFHSAQAIPGQGAMAPCCRKFLKISIYMLNYKYYSKVKLNGGCFNNAWAI
jgi:hypothetical protein